MISSVISSSLAAVNRINEELINPKIIIIKNNKISLYIRIF
jgi:hypothetical protein